MNERWVTLGGALLALVFATGLLFPRLGPKPPPASRPTSQEAGPAGLLGAYRWLEGAGIRVRRLRTRYTGLAALTGGSSGNLLVLSEPMRYPLRESETAALQSWVGQGNSLLVLLADGARPDWAVQGLPGYFSGGVLNALGIVPAAPDKGRAHICQMAQPDKGDDAPKPDEIPLDGRLRLLPSPTDVQYPLLAGVRAVDIYPDRAARLRGFSTELQYRDGGDRIYFTWLCDTARQRDAMWQFRHGAGSIWVTGYSDLFANANLGHADNARLLANLVGLSLAAGGAVVFDDMHQGDSELYDPEAFFRDPRLHASLGLLLLLWLVYLLGSSNRFRPPAPPPAGVTPAAFARALGGFYARSVDGTDAARSLLAQFHADARRRLKRPGQGPAWEALERAPGVDRAALQALRREQQRFETTARQPRDLRRLAALIHQLRESLR